MTDGKDRVYSDGLLVDKLYMLNRFYWGSSGQHVKQDPVRPSMVATTLMESASNDFQRSALFLSDHIDTLYELIEPLQLGDLDRGESPQKRCRRTQSIHSAKRASHSST